MAGKASVDGAYRLINHGPVVLVTAWDEKNGRPTVMTAAWSMPLSKTPMRVGVVIGVASHTRALIIDETKEFVLNVPSVAIESAVNFCGSCHGNKVNKFVESGLTPMLAEKVNGPIRVKECLGHIECKLHQVVKVGEGASAACMLIGDVVAASANTSVYYGDRYHFDAADPSKTSLHHGGGSLYFKAAALK